MTNPTLINIDIDSSKDYARVSYTNPQKQTNVKRVPITSLPDLIRDTSSDVIKESDTGFISEALIRESVSSGQVRRLYLIPTVKFSGHFKLYNNLPEAINPDNKYGFHTVTREYGNHIVFPYFELRNFGMYIVNANNEEFTNASHQFGCISTNLFNLVDNNSSLLPAILNHHETNVCWHRTFDRNILSSKDTRKQVNAIYAYLNSDFNADLNYRNTCMHDEIFSKFDQDALEEYVKEVFPNHSVSRLRAMYRDDRSNYWINMFFLYYFTTVEGNKLEDVTRPSSGGHINFIQGFN